MKPKKTNKIKKWWEGEWKNNPRTTGIGGLKTQLPDPIDYKSYDNDGFTSYTLPYTAMPDFSGLNSLDAERVSIELIKKQYMEMKKLQMNQPFSPYISHDFKNPEAPKDHRLVIFFGFNGLLAMKYAWVEGLSWEEANNRMQVSGSKIPWKLMYGTEFMPILTQFEGTPNALIETTLEDALNVIRVGTLPETEEFIDAEEDEFGDNCVETCKPGDHACGK